MPLPVSVLVSRLTLLLSTQLSDKVISGGLFALSALAGILFILILAFLAHTSWSVLQWGFLPAFFGLQWFPLEGLFGILPMVFGSLLMMVGVLVLAVPLGFLCALFLAFLPVTNHSSRSLVVIQRFFRGLIQIFAGIPSVIFGFWGLTVLVPLINLWHPPGASVLAAIILLSLMVLPTLILTMLSALQGVPSSLNSGARALGLSRTCEIFHVVLPAAKPGLLAGIALALARAVGETMAVVMVAGNVVQIPSSVFDPVRVLTANIALEMAYAVDIHRSSLYASGLILTLTVTVLAFYAARFQRVGGEYDS